ncbi:hypothetical protein Droror1_Dr00023410, partial [Drosera rotundifolia]
MEECKLGETRRTGSRNSKNVNFAMLREIELELKTKTNVDGRLSWEMERRWEIEEEEMVSKIGEREERREMEKMNGEKGRRWFAYSGFLGFRTPSTSLSLSLNGFGSHPTLSFPSHIHVTASIDPLILSHTCRELMGDHLANELDHMNEQDDAEAVVDYADEDNLAIEDGVPVYNLVMCMLWRHPENIELEKVKVLHYCAVVCSLNFLVLN